MVRGKPMNPVQRKQSWENLDADLKATCPWEQFKRLLSANDNDLERTVTQIKIRKKAIELKK